MKKHTERKQGAHDQSLAVCQEHRTLFEATTGGKRALTQMEASVADVDSLSAEQSQCLERRREAREARVEAKAALFGGLKHVVTISAFVQLDEGTAEVMQLPRKANDRMLIDDGNAILDKVTPYTKAFIEAGLPEHVIIDLPKQIEALTTARRAMQSSRQQFTAAAKAMQIALQSGDDALEVLETILNASPNPDPKAIERLRLAKRIGPKRVKEHVPAADPATPNPTPTAKSA